MIISGFFSFTGVEDLGEIAMNADLRRNPIRKHFGVGWPFAPKAPA